MLKTQKCEIYVVIHNRCESRGACARTGFMAVVGQCSRPFRRSIVSFELFSNEEAYSRSFTVVVRSFGQTLRDRKPCSRPLWLDHSCRVYCAPRDICNINTSSLRSLETRVFVFEVKGSSKNENYSIVSLRG